MFSTEFQYSLTILKANDGTYGFYYHEKDQEQKLIINVTKRQLLHYLNNRLNAFEDQEEELINETEETEV